MRDEPVVQDWELLAGSDLAPYLLSTGQLRCAQRPASVGMIPVGALGALARCAGRCGLEDLLLVPGTVRPAGSRWRHRCRYAPLCVLGIGERGLGLWAEAPPAPDVQVVLPFSEVAAVELSACGPYRALTVTGQSGKLSVSFDADGDTAAGTWLRRLRTRCAGQSQALPDDPHSGRRACPHSLRPLLLDETDDAVTASRRSLPWRRSGLLAVTPQEVIVARFQCAWPRPWRASTETAWVPRCAATGATVRPRALLLCGDSVRVPLPSRAAAAAASRWLGGPGRENSGRRRPGQRDQRNPGTARAGERPLWRCQRGNSRSSTRSSAA
jgi:hypothetical protein